KGWGVGGSPLRLIEGIRKLGKRSSRSLTTYGDVALGYQSKASNLTTGRFVVEEAATHDWGVSGRLALARGWGAEAPFRLDLSGAYAQLNNNPFEGNRGDATTTQIDRIGVALQLSPAPPSERSASPPSLPWWRPADVPEVAMVLAYDHDVRHFTMFVPVFS